MKRRTFAVLAGLLATAAFVGAMAYARYRGQRLPYRDGFASNSAAEWTAIGGAWQINHGVVYNRSDERGAKLVTGSERWSNYQLRTDLQLIGNDGDVGVMVRLGDEERGIDSYDGYYIGLRSTDSALVIGRADYGWVEGRPAAMLGGVQSGVWYRLRVVVAGCNIGAEATNIATGQTTWEAFHEDSCVSHGKIGLRSMATGGAWRNIVVTHASDADWLAIRQHAAFVSEPIYPGREADYNRMREAYFKETYTPARSYQSAIVGMAEKGGDAERERQLVSIGDLRTLPSPTGPVTIRGVVTLTSPLYIQDSTGGTAVLMTTAKTVALNLGDEVEIAGTPQSAGFSAPFRASSIRLLWDRTQMVPLSITSTQAASGAFESSLVELSGTLLSKQKDANGVITLQMADVSQNYTATVRGWLSTAAYNSWEKGSQLRLRGICTVSQPSSRGESFAILLRSIDDVEVLSGPPWWTGQRILRLVFLGFALLALGVYLYLRIERWKMRAILSERERLAHQMHDTLAQSFAGVSFHLQGVRNGLRGGQFPKESVLEKLNVACALVAQTHREASANIAALHPEADEGYDLLAALERCMQAMLEGNSLPLSLVREGTPRQLSLAVRDALFNIGREAIANILRHSRANAIVLKLRYEPKNVLLEVRDNGAGFQYDPSASNFGIRTMQRRAGAVGGELKIASEPQMGTTLTVRTPYEARHTLADWVRSLRLFAHPQP